MGGAAADTTTVVGDKEKVGIHDYNFFEHQIIFISPQD